MGEKEKADEFHKEERIVRSLIRYNKSGKF